MNSGPPALLIAVLLGLAACSKASAASEPSPPVESGQSLLLFGPAVADVIDEHPAAMVFVEYRYTTGRYRPGPWAALEATSDDLFAGVGAFIDIPLGRRCLFTPSLGAALYDEGDGLRLGYPLEFRSTIEFTWRVGAWRAGASLAHFSNAGLGETNRGTEVLKLLWVMPLGPAAQ